MSLCELSFFGLAYRLTHNDVQFANLILCPNELILTNEQTNLYKKDENVHKKKKKTNAR